MAGPHDRIVFSLDQQEPPKSALDEEREKHKTRCAPTTPVPGQLPISAGCCAPQTSCSTIQLSKHAPAACSLQPTHTSSLANSTDCSVAPSENSHALLLRRAERFGTDYKDPAEVNPRFTQQARLQRLRREGFATGIDIFSEVRCCCGAEQQGSGRSPSSVAVSASCGYERRQGSCSGVRAQGP